MAIFTVVLIISVTTGGRARLAFVVITHSNSCLCGSARKVTAGGRDVGVAGGHDTSGELDADRRDAVASPRPV